MTEPALLRPTGEDCDICKRPLHEATCATCGMELPMNHSCFGGQPVVECWPEGRKRKHAVTFVELG